MLSIISDFLLSLLHLLIEIPIIWIGEITLWIITLGKHRPRWDSYTHEGGSDFVFLSELSFWIGIAALAIVGVTIKWVFFTPI